MDGDRGEDYLDPHVLQPGKGVWYIWANMHGEIYLMEKHFWKSDLTNGDEIIVVNQRLERKFNKAQEQLEAQYDVTAHAITAAELNICSFTHRRVSAGWVKVTWSLFNRAENSSTIYGNKGLSNAVNYCRAH